jgi:dCMP deaminase
MKNSWISYFFVLCDAVSTKSKDPTTKVGAVVIGSQHQVLGTAFNGLPMGVYDNPTPDMDFNNRYTKEKKYDYMSHAEANIIALAARHGVRLDGAKLFVNLQPCCECTKLIIQAGIKEVYCRKDEGTGGWREKIPIAMDMCSEAGVKVFVFDEFGKQDMAEGTGHDLNGTAMPFGGDTE